jgi:Zinc finger found in FPG and IleRS
MVLHPIRKPCPVCGGPMNRVRDDVQGARETYVCTRCEADPLRDPIAQNWAASPLSRPAES